MRKILLSLLVVLAFTSAKAGITQDSCCFDIDTLVITGDTVACYNDSVQLCVPYDSCLTYQWYYNSSPISSSNSNCIYASQTGSYYVTAWNDCDTSSSDSLYVHINSMLDGTISCKSSKQLNSCELTANPTGGQSPYTYLWSTSSTSQTIIATEGMSYVVTITDAMDCSIIIYGSCAICGFSRNASLDIENEEIAIYPNPSSGQVSIDLPEELKGAEVEISVLDLSGKKVFESNYLDQTTVTLDLNHLKSGVYFIEFFSGEYIQKKRIIIEK